MNSHPRYKFVKPLNRFEFEISSIEINKDIEFINSNFIESIEINDVKGFKKNNIDFLRNINNIKHLTIVSDTITNFDGLSNLEGLEELYISSLIEKVNIDFNQFNKIKKINIPYDTNIVGLENCINIEDLYLHKGKISSIDFGKFTRLKSLTLSDSSDVIDSLSFLPVFPNLIELSFSYLKNFKSLNGLEKFANSLASFELFNCKNVSNINLIFELINLEKIILSNSVSIESTGGFKYLQKLKHLAVTGTSFFIDGDLTVLKNMEIDYVAIDNKKHYNLKFEDF